MRSENSSARAFKLPVQYLVKVSQQNRAMCDKRRCQLRGLILELITRVNLEGHIHLYLFLSFHYNLKFGKYLEDEVLILLMSLLYFLRRRPTLSVEGMEYCVRLVDSSYETSPFGLKVLGILQTQKPPVINNNNNNN